MREIIKTTTATTKTKDCTILYTLRCRNRAQIFGGFIVFLSVIALVIGLIQVTAVRDALHKELGDDQIALLTAYSRGEDVRLYLDEAVRHTANVFFPELYARAFDLGCFSEDGIQFWSNSSGLCVPLQQEISRTIRTGFANELNVRLGDFAHPNIFTNFTTADLMIDDSKHTLKGIPFTPVEFFDSYSVLLSFSTSIPQNIFARDAVGVFTKINEDCSAAEDTVDDDSLTQCLHSTLEKINTEQNRSQWKQGAACEREGSKENSDRAAFTEFAEFVNRYNDCARSLDTNCMCSFEEASLNDRYLLASDTKSISFAGKTLSLEIPLQGTLEGARGRAVKKNRTIVFEEDTFGKDTDDQLPFCRPNDRTTVICRVAEDSPVLTVGVFVLDRAKPKLVTPHTAVTGYEWKQSLSGDVQEYRIYIAKKSLPFALESSPAAIISRPENAAHNMSYAIDSTQFDILVVPVDVEGNMG